MADSDLRILGFDGIGHIRCRHLHAIQLRRIEPNTHGILRAIGVDIANAVNTTQRVLNITGDIVRDILLIHRTVGGDKGNRQDIRITGFTDRDALILHRLRQFSHG
ncbi:hypothetical protein D3C80_1118020 [compost metagenome]